MADAGVMAGPPARREDTIWRRYYRSKMIRKLRAQNADLLKENARLRAKLEYVELDLRTERCMQQKIAQRQAGRA